MGLKKAESQVKVLLGDTIVALCRNTLNFHAEISVEGLLGITLDNEEIFLVNINQTIKNPDAPANQDKDDGHKRRATSNDRHGKSSSDDSSTDDSDDSTPRRKRRRRNRKKRRSGAPSDGDAVDGSFSKHSAQDNARRSNESRVTHSDTGQCTQSVPPDVAQSANHSNVTLSVVSHSNVLQSPDLHPNVGQSTSCQSHVSPSASSGQANNSQSGNSTADNDTGQNGVVSVKQEVMSDDENQDEDLIIVKEEIGDAEHPNPVLLFPNVSQTLQQSDPFLTGAPQTSLPQSFMSSTSQSLPSSSPVPGPSNMCPTSGEIVESIVDANSSGPYCECPLCDRRFGRKGTLKKHLSSVHFDNPTHRCRICGKGYMSKTFLKAHEMKHENKKGFECETCGQQFVHKKNLVQHMDRHKPDTEVKTCSVTCGICGKVIAKSNWSRHENVHGVPKHRCPYCDKRFRDKSGYLRHIRRHSAVVKSEKKT